MRTNRSKGIPVETNSVMTKFSFILKTVLAVLGSLAVLAIVPSPAPAQTTNDWREEYAYNLGVQA